MKKKLKLVKNNGKIKELQQDRAITLIALVITIIVLLILAGVTINIIINGGLIGQAQNATDRYKQAEGEELNSLDNIVAKMNIMEENGIGGNPNIPAKPGEPLTEKALPGDYVRYEVPEKNFTITTEQTGYTEEQTFSTADYTGLWQVLYNDDEHGLQLISADVVTNEKGLYLKGKEGYNKSIATLNNFCSNYVNATYATNARCVGTNPIHPEGTTDLFEGVDDYQKQHDMIRDDREEVSDYNAMKEATHQNTDGLHCINEEYWMASRRAFAYDDEGNLCHNASYSTTFSVVYSQKNGALTLKELLYINKIGSFSNRESYAGVRVVVNLREEVKTNNGTGEKERPYELVL